MMSSMSGGMFKGLNFRDFLVNLELISINSLVLFHFFRC